VKGRGLARPPFSRARLQAGEDWTLSRGHWRWLAALAIAVAALPFHPAAAHGTRQGETPRIAVVVGPVGPLTPTYLALAERAAIAAELKGAVVNRAYSPDATPRRVLDAIEGANVIVYFGHGTGFPNPYGATLNPDKVNGWGLQGPKAARCSGALLKLDSPPLARLRPRPHAHQPLYSPLRAAR